MMQLHFGAADFILGYLTIIMFLLKRDIISLETWLMESGCFCTCHTTMILMVPQKTTTTSSNPPHGLLFSVLLDFWRDRLTFWDILATLEIFVEV